MRFITKLLSIAAVVGTLLSPAAAETLTVRADGGFGAGVYIGNGMVLTVSHVIEGSERLKLRTEDGKRYEATVYKNVPEYDFAILRIDTGPKQFPIASNVDCRPAVVGEPIEAIGHPFGFLFTHTWGKIARSKVNKINDLRAGQLVDLTIAPGNSGGPVYDAKGSVIGLVTATLVMNDKSEAPIALGIIVPMSAVCAFFQS